MPDVWKIKDALLGDMKFKRTNIEFYGRYQSNE
jgi:hypothetical protein